MKRICRKLAAISFAAFAIFALLHGAAVDIKSADAVWPLVLIFGVIASVFWILGTASNGKRYRVVKSQGRVRGGTKR